MLTILQVVDGYFVHFFAPSDMKEIPKDVLLILDCSGSMYGGKIRQMEAAVIGVLKDLHEGDRFNILEFSDRVEYYKKSMVYANKKSIDDAKEYVESLSATGGTCQSLQKKCKSLKVLIYSICYSKLIKKNFTCRLHLQVRNFVGFF